MFAELQILNYYGAFVLLTLGLHAATSVAQLGAQYLLSARDEPREITGKAARLERALANSVQTLVLVAIPILVMGVKDAFSGHSLLACQVFFVARVIYLPAYVFGIPVLRTFVWAVGFLMTAGLYFLAL